MKQFTFEYDMAKDMSPVKGQLVFNENGHIFCAENSTEQYNLKSETIKELKVRAGVGCGLLYATFEDAPDKVLCRFTMSGLQPAGEFCKIVNFYNLTGSAAIPDEIEQRVCPKCHRPMVKDIKVCVFCYSQMSVMKRAVTFLKPSLTNITISQIFNILGICAMLMSPIFMRILIDQHLEPQIGTWGQILIICGAMLGVRVLRDGLDILGGRIFNKATIAIANDVRTSAYTTLQSHSMTLFAKRTPGDLVRRIMDDTDTIGEFLTWLSRWVVEMVFMFVVALVILLFTNWQLTLLIFIPVPIVIILMYNFRKIISARFERQWRRSSRVNSILHDIIKGIRTVKSFGNEKREIDKYAAANKDLATIQSNNEVLWGLMFPPMSFIIGTGEFLVLFFGGMMVLNGTMSIGVLIQFTMFLGFIYGPLRWLVNVPRWIANVTTSMVKVFELLDDESEITAVTHPNDVDISGAVAFDKVYFGYKSYEPVLKGVSVDIKPGEMIGLVGKSGVGKSTLINLAMRLYDPNNGTITINEADLRSITPDHLHENMGVVFQDNFLFAGTFYENIIYGKPDASYEEVIAAAKAANAHDFILKTSDGYNTLIGEGGQTLSGGERQRLSIARAIIKNPDILILDEATSSLDVETEAAIQESLNQITKGRTVIAIAHRLSTLRNADRLVVLDEGGVAEVGTHSELLKKKGLYYNLVMAQRQNSRKMEAMN